MFVPVPSPAEMARWDAAALSWGIPEDVLMENAAREAFVVLRRHFGPLNGASVLIVMGGGNNGGDAACLARHLLDAGALPRVIHTRPFRAIRGSARRYAALARRLGVPFLPAPAPERLLRGGNSLTEDRAVPDIVVDGLLGTGFSGDLRPREAALVAGINALASRSFLLALDVPSGLDASTGKARPDAVRANVTVTFEAAKPGLIVPEAAPYAGLLEIRPIGLPARAKEEHPASYRLWRCAAEFPPDQDAPRASFRRPPDRTDPFCLTTGPQLPDPASVAPFFRPNRSLPGPGHKGEAGRVLVAGGSDGLSGALRLAALGALRGGAGLVVAAAPEDVMPFVRNDLPEVTTLLLPRIAGVLPGSPAWTRDHAALTAPVAQQSRAVVVGPGMGRGNGAEDFVEELLRLPARPPLVLDADALVALSARPGLLALLRPDDVLTPHPGEAAVFLDTDAAGVQADRFAALEKLRNVARAVWVLKGAGTLVGAPDQPSSICPWHVPTLAVGGSGDVLAGLIGALIAQGHDPALAACLGVHLHALAGWHLTRRFPLRGCSPRDIANALPMVRPLLGEPDPQRPLRAKSASPEEKKTPRSPEDRAADAPAGPARRGTPCE